MVVVRPRQAVRLAEPEVVFGEAVALRSGDVLLALRIANVLTLLRQSETNMMDRHSDSWFGNKIGPYQHFYIARTKSLIANKPLVRVSNNGISGIIDNNGKIIKFSQLNQISKLTHKFKINKNKSYFYFHKFFSYYILILFIILIIIIRKRISEFR